MMVRGILGAGALYFALVFGVGFVVGFVRVLWLVPLVGERAAELLEAPLMLAVTIVAARGVVRRRAVPPTTTKRLGVGLVALGLMLVVELTFVLGLRGMTLREYLTGRDAVAGTVYVTMLVIFVLMPLVVRR
jgi:hypothetical protein